MRRRRLPSGILYQRSEHAGTARLSMRLSLAANCQPLRGSPKKSFVHFTDDVSVCCILLLSFVLVFSVFTERTTKYLAGLAVECQCEFSTLGGLSVTNNGLLLSWDKRARIGEPAALATALTQTRDKKKPQACADIQLLQLCTPARLPPALASWQIVEVHHRLGGVGGCETKSGAEPRALIRLYLRHSLPICHYVHKCTSWHLVIMTRIPLLSFVLVSTSPFIKGGQDLPALHANWCGCPTIFQSDVVGVTRFNFRLVLALQFLHTPLQALWHYTLFPEEVKL